MDAQTPSPPQTSDSEQDRSEQDRSEQDRTDVTAVTEPASRSETDGREPERGAGLGPGGSFRWISLAETVVGLAIALSLSYLLRPDDPGFMTVQPHPFWIIVLLISIRYPLVESFTCTAIIASTHILFLLGPESATYQFSTIGLFAVFSDPLLFLVVAGFVSGYSQRLLDRTLVLRRQLQERDQRIFELRDQHVAVEQALRQLEDRIASGSSSILDLFSELAATRTMNREQMKRSLLDILGRYLRAEQARYFDVEHGQLRPRYMLAPDGTVAEVDDPPFAPDSQRDFVLAGALDTRSPSHLGLFTQEADLEQYQGSSLMAGPLLVKGEEPIGLVSIDRIAFLDYTPYTIRRLGTVLDWWSRILQETLRLEQLQAESIFDQELGLFTYPYFISRVSQEFERTRRFALPMSVAFVRIKDCEQIGPDRLQQLKATLARIIKLFTSELEITALYKRNDTLALSFPIAMAADAEKRVRDIQAEVERYDFHPYQDPHRRLDLVWAIADYQIGMDSHHQLIDRLERSLHDLSQN